jgi:hypothetical protein
MNTASQAEDPTAIQPMPQIPFGSYKISRLILGGNPINGGSHMSRFIDISMRRYFTPERRLGILSDAEGEGINLWQTCPIRQVPSNLDIYLRHREQGGQIRYMIITTSEENLTAGGMGGDNYRIARIADAGGIAVAHWGSFTDTMWRAGQINRVQNFLKKVRDAGLVAGLATHIPEVVDYVESKGWDVDFYMTCVYNPERGREEVEALLGHVPVPGNGREVYLEDDPPRMFNMVQQTSKMCLVFKILAAGRLCRNQEMVEQAFKQTFSQIKASDAVIVGMYPEHEDQVRLNAGYVRKYSELSK